jgi:hypothetical protein
MRFGHWRLLLVLLCLVALGGAWASDVKSGAISDASRSNSTDSNGKSADDFPRYTLKAEQVWQLNLPGGERFDASGLALTASGELLTINDRGPLVYRIQFVAGSDSANLIEVPNCFTTSQLKPYAREKIDRYDTEGVAVDSDGQIYICEEANRWVLRCNPAKGTVERLPIDWTPVRKYFDSFDRNASFEGITLADGRLYVANERQMGRIIVVDLKTLRVIDDFAPRPKGSHARDIHYSDLSWYDGVLYALLRESRCILAVNPANHQVLAEYDYKEMERDPEVAYRALYFFAGQMEGLALDRDFFWLVTDNNGTGRVKYPKDTRPTLFKCRRPDAGQSKAK